MTTTIPETALSVVIEALATCLCNQIAEDGLKKTCFCGVIPGDSVPVDMVTKGCGSANGAAFVRLVNTYPSSEVGVASLQPGNCAVGQGFDLEIGIFRCFPLDRGGKSPKPSVLLEQSKLQMADEQAMRRALSCCDWLDAKDFVTGLYAPVGPEGGIIGGTIPLSGWLP